MSARATHSARWGPFIIVGLLGFAVQIASLILLTRAGLPYAVATVAGVELAIVHNFAWHERWTWRDRPCARNARLRRFVRFNAACMLVSAAAVALTILLVEYMGLPIVLANTLAVAASSALTFTAADRSAFAVLQATHRAS